MEFGGNKILKLEVVFQWKVEKENICFFLQTKFDMYQPMACVLNLFGSIKKWRGTLKKCANSKMDPGIYTCQPFHRVLTGVGVEGSK